MSGVVSISIVKSIMQWELYSALTHNNIGVTREVKLKIPKEIHLSDQPVKALRMHTAGSIPCIFQSRPVSCGKDVI